LKANEIPKLLRPTKTRELAFISSYRKSKENNYLSGVESIKNFSRVVTALNLFVRIAGSETNEFGGQAEKDFFAQSLNGCNWEIRRKLTSSTSYDLARSMQFVIVESSSLGYECLGMGMRVGFIAFRPQHRQDRRFGKPLEFGEKGPFWTNDPSEEEIGRILDYLLSVSDEQWERDSGWIRDQLMVHDYGNTKIRAYVEGVLTDSLESK
ncbi:MAG: hypothetical protein ACO3VC_07190, partial [Ilumatobacteraceae bacterium]